MSALLDAIRADIGQVFAHVYDSASVIRPGAPVGGTAYQHDSRAASVVYPCNALVTRWRTNYVRDGLVSQNDLRVSILQSTISVEPEENWLITVNSVVYRISGTGGSLPAVSQDVAGGAWACRAVSSSREQLEYLMDEDEIVYLLGL